MIAEFYGLPGSGKSTLVNLIKERYPEKAELIVFSKKIFTKKNIRYIFSAEFIAFHFKLMRLWFLKLFTMKTELFSKKGFRDELKTAVYFTALYLEFMYLRQHDDGGKLYIVDHGLIQCLSSLVWDKKNINRRSDSLIRYIDKRFSKKVDYVYTAGCGVEETYNRIMDREWPIRLHSYRREDGLAILENLEDLFEKAKEIFSESGSVVYIDNSLDKAEGFGKLCDYFNIKGE